MLHRRVKAAPVRGALTLQTAPDRSLTTGILLTLLTGCLFASLDSVGKLLMASVPVVQILWARYLIHTMLVGAYLSGTTGSRFLRMRRPVAQLARGLALLCSSLFMYWGMLHVPIAAATAMLFVTPVIVTGLSAVLLRERIGMHRIAAIVLAVAGVVLIVRPGAAGTSPWLLLPLLAAFTNAAFFMLTRALAGADDSEATQFNTTAIGSAALTVAVATSWETPTPPVAVLMLASGLLSLLGHYTLVRAFSYASAARLSPFLYSQLIFATIFGTVVFGETPHPGMALGAVLIVGAGLSVWWRESRLTALAPGA